MDRVCNWLAAEPALTSRQLAAKLRDEHGLTVHPRSIERALVRCREPESAGDEVPIARRAARQ
jgi:hypothetical protein